MNSIETYLDICQQVGVYVHAQKPISSGPPKHTRSHNKFPWNLICPRKLQGLTFMPPPQTAAELEKFLCSANWIRNSMPDYNRKVQLLSARLQEAMSHVGMKKRRNRLLNSAYLLKNKRKGLHPITDASDSAWGPVLTQTPTKTLSSM